MPGRKPKPTALKKLNGNPGRRPLNQNEPAPPVQIPDCPDHVQGIAREHWIWLTGELHKLGLISKIHATVIAMMCTLYARWFHAEEMVRKWGPMALPTQKANEQKLQGALPGMEEQETNPVDMAWNPYLSIATKSMSQYMKLAVEFGLTPSSQSRINAPQAEEKDESADFLDGEQAGFADSLPN